MTVTVHHGDSREVLKGFADASFSAVVCDPPYALVSIVKRFGAEGAAPASATSGAYARASAGFMGQTWDTGETAFDPGFWREVWRVLKPGGHVIAASGTRTYHRLACAVEDAGFEIRDMLSWLYASGFPKSHDVARALPAWEGWGTALKPACEPWVLARKPVAGTVAANVQAHGCGALNIDACRVEGEAWAASGEKRGAGPAPIFDGQLNNAGRSGAHDLGRHPANLMHDDDPATLAGFPPGASRYFFSAKAGALDRHGSNHPTVKPVALMRWLCRLVTPPGGVILDPFAGTGTTGLAAAVEGFDCVLIEREARFVADINRRLDHLAGLGPHAGQERARRKAGTLDALPLFGGDESGRPPAA